MWPAGFRSRPISYSAPLDPLAAPPISSRSVVPAFSVRPPSCAGTPGGEPMSVSVYELSNGGATTTCADAGAANAAEARRIVNAMTRKKGTLPRRPGAVNHDWPVGEVTACGRCTAFWP